LALVLPAVLPAGVCAQGIGVSAPQYDSPGAVVPAIVTAYGVPKGHRVTITARATAGATTTCVGDVWINRVRKTASRKCYVRLPDRRGSYRMFRRARIVAADGTVVGSRNGFASRPIIADGYRSPRPMSLQRIERIERCFNPTSRVWLTFDDGGSHTQVRHILRTLAANDVRGRFFFTGAWADANPQLLAAIKQAGHLVANHSYTHPALSRVSAAEVGRQMSRGIAATTKPRLLRPPFAAGALSARLEGLAAARGYRLCRWTVDSYDWQGPTGARMAERVRFGDEMTPPIRAGGNILMHGTAPHTSGELQLIIDAVRRAHLVLDPLR
jgi:peptidoglycan/xylan/chitin deacetylase (PgdA/CDA1 family)